MKILARSQLPDLVFGEPPPISVDQFMDLAEMCLDEDTLDVLSRMVADDGGAELDDPDVLQQIEEHDRLMSQDTRAMRQSRRQDSPAMLKITESGDYDGNPLEVELRLQRKRFDHSADLTAHLFDEQAYFIGYLHMLQILSKCAHYQHQPGEKRYSALSAPRGGTM